MTSHLARLIVGSILLTVLLVALAGCGDSDSATVAAPKASPEQIQNTGKVAMIHAHQLASLQLYEQGEFAKSAKHAGHPVEEIFFALARTLRSKDAALTGELRKALKRPNDLIFARKPAAELAQAYMQSQLVVQRVEEILVPKAIHHSTAFKAQVIASLLEESEAEYDEALKGAKLVNEIEYQDAWGALAAATDRFKAARGGFGGEAGKIEPFLAKLSTNLPGVNPPRTLTTAADLKSVFAGAFGGLVKVADKASTR